MIYLVRIISLEWRHCLRYNFCRFVVESLSPFIWDWSAEFIRVLYLGQRWNNRIGQDRFTIAVPYETQNLLKYDWSGFRGLSGNQHPYSSLFHIVSYVFSTMSSSFYFSIPSYRVQPLFIFSAYSYHHCKSILSCSYFLSTIGLYFCSNWQSFLSTDWEYFLSTVELAINLDICRNFFFIGLHLY